MQQKTTGCGNQHQICIASQHPVTDYFPLTTCHVTYYIRQNGGNGNKTMEAVQTETLPKSKNISKMPMAAPRSLR